MLPSSRKGGSRPRECDSRITVVPSGHLRRGCTWAVAGSCESPDREVDAVFGFRAWSENAPLSLDDAVVVDGCLAAAHETVGFELPQFVAVAAPPLAVVVVPLVLESDGDAVAAEAPQFLSKCVVLLTLPFRGKEVDDGGTADDVQVPVPPDRVRCVGEGDLLRVAAVPPSSAACTFCRANDWSNGGKGGRNSVIGNVLVNRSARGCADRGCERSPGPGGDDRLPTAAG